MDIHELKICKAQDLRIFMVKAFCLNGVPEADAHIVTDNLLTAELKGIESHGLSRFPVYLKRISKRLVNPRPQIAVIKPLPAVIMMDGDNGLGSVVMMKALEEGMKAAQETGISIIGIKHSNHFGISGYYCEQAAEHGFVSILLTNSPPATPAWGSKEPYFGTNPIAFGMPRKQQPHIVVDMATSVAARGRIINAAQKAEPIPEGWALDKDGYATTDPKAALEGVLLPIAGPKGYALSLTVEHLAGVFTGAAYGKGVAWQYGGNEEPANVGHTLILIRADSFMQMTEYQERTEAFVGEIKNLDLAPGYEAIKLPGEREWEREQNLRLTGELAVNGGLYKQFIEIANDLGLQI